MGVTIQCLKVGMAKMIELLRVSGYELRVFANFQLPTTDCGLPTD